MLVTLGVSTTTRQAHASALTGTAYIGPRVINSTQYPFGSVFSVTVQVAGMDLFYGWDVSVRTNPLVISPINVSYGGDLFEENYSIPHNGIQQVANCLNGICSVGQPTGTDGPGVAHSSVALFPVPPRGTIVPPIDGTIFTITYNVTGRSGFSRIEIVDSTFQNGTTTPVPHLIGPGGVYGVERPDFGVYASPTTLSVFQESNISTTITVQSFAGFAGTLNLNVSNELHAVFDHSALSVTANGTSSVQLTFVATVTTAAYDYIGITITASNATTSRFLHVNVNVETFPDFMLEITPSLLRIHAGNSANTTIEVVSANTFSGNVSLTVQVPANVTYVLGSTSLFVRSGEQLRTSLNITTPMQSLPFVYLINVTGLSRSSGAGGVSYLFHTQTLIVKPPPPSFTVSINPSVILVRAGLTSSVKITVRSVDYFWQYVYLSATMSGGAASFDSNSYYMPLPDSKYASTTQSVNFTLSVYVPIDQVPGHYIVLVNVYQNLLTQTIGIPVTITSLSAFHNSSTPRILGLSPPVYFGILGFLIIPLIILGISAYRKNLEDKDEDWKA